MLRRMGARRWVWLALWVVFGCSSSEEAVFSKASSSAEAGVGGNSTSSAGGSAGAPGGGEAGQAGSPGAGGAGGVGGAPCLPKTCNDMPGACAFVDDGCGMQLDCTAVCIQIHTTCGLDGFCQCQAIDQNTGQGLCSPNQYAPSWTWCQQHGGCEHFFCGENGNPQAPGNCMVFGEAPNGDDIWCCYDAMSN